MRTLLLTGVLASLLTAGGCASTGGTGNDDAITFQTTGGIAPAKAAAREVLLSHDIVIDEQVDGMMSMLGLGGAGPVQMIVGRSPGGSDVTASLSQAGTAGEVNVLILVDDPEDDALEAAIADDLRAALGVPTAMP